MKIGWLLCLLVGVVGCQTIRHRQVEILQQQSLVLKTPPLEVACIQEITQDCTIALNASITNRRLEAGEFERIEKFLGLAAWVLQLKTPSLSFALTNDKDQSFYYKGGIYFSANHKAEAPFSVLSVLLHEVGHAIFNERKKSPWDGLLSPGRWFTPTPDSLVTEECRAEICPALFNSRLSAYTGSCFLEELRFYPVCGKAEVEETSKFFRGDPIKQNSLKFLTSLQAVNTYQELGVLSKIMAGTEDEKSSVYPLSMLCLILLESHFKETEKVWQFLHHCDDAILEEKIDAILADMPANLALKIFIDNRKDCFTFPK